MVRSSQLIPVSKDHRLLKFRSLLLIIIGFVRDVIVEKKGRKNNHILIVCGWNGLM